MADLIREIEMEQFRDDIHLHPEAVALIDGAPVAGESQVVAPGQHLSYRVTARDRAEPPNESEPSDTVEMDVVREPGRDGP